MTSVVADAVAKAARIAADPSRTPARGIVY
jgi:hypothetical protein